MQDERGRRNITSDLITQNKIATTDQQFLGGVGLTRNLPPSGSLGREGLSDVANFSAEWSEMEESLGLEATTCPEAHCPHIVHDEVQ